jgi:hypothetical protein
MSTLAKFVMATIAILFIALATVIILKAQTPLEEPVISAPMDPAPLDPAPLDPVPLDPQAGTPEPSPSAEPTTPNKRKFLPGNRRLGNRLRRTPPATTP